MPFPMKIQPIDSQPAFGEQSKPLVLKYRLKRLFDRPFNGVLKISSDKLPSISGDIKDSATTEFEPSSVCLDKMVQNFLEDNISEKALVGPPAAQKCGRNRCNCFNGNNDSSDDESDFEFEDSITNTTNTNSNFWDSIDSLKGLLPCATKVERNLLADISKIVEKIKTFKRKDDLRKIVIHGLLALGFKASICKSKWDKSSSISAGEYEFIDVIMEGERVVVDVDFRSEFEIARSTGSYKTILQSLPFIFVGKSDRLLQIITIVSEAARQSLKKKGMHVAPWRKTEYVKAKWFSPFVRLTNTGSMQSEPPQDDGGAGDGEESEIEAEKVEVKETDEGNECGELVLVFGVKDTPSDASDSFLSSVAGVSVGEERDVTPVTEPWQPPAVSLKSCDCERGNRAVVTGLLDSLFKEKP